MSLPLLNNFRAAAFAEKSKFFYILSKMIKDVLQSSLVFSLRHLSLYVGIAFRVLKLQKSPVTEE